MARLTDPSFNFNHWADMIRYGLSQRPAEQVVGIAMRNSAGPHADVRLQSGHGVMTLEVGTPVRVGELLIAGPDGRLYPRGHKFETAKEDKVEKKAKKKVKLSARDHLTMAVQAEYKDDRLAPSVITAWLDPAKTFGTTKSGFYASIVRYPTGSTERHNVVARTSGHDTCDQAIKALAKEWLGISSAKDALRAAVGL